MTVLAGGLRSRMIFDNLYAVINDGLEALGWYETGRKHQPITCVIEEQDVTHAVAVNTLALSDENVTTELWEIGSTLSQDTRYYYIDFFAESDAIGKHVIGDVRDILLGKLPSIGRSGPTLTVYDLRQPTPPQVFACDIMSVRIDRSHDYTHPWLRHWYSIQMTLFDYYTNSNG